METKELIDKLMFDYDLNEANKSENYRIEGALLDAIMETRKAILTPKEHKHLVKQAYTRGLQLGVIMSIIVIAILYHQC